jgi:dolichol-phosphate mannosyltransferase
MVSVVVPIFNEEENLAELRTRMTASLDSIGEPWELICVNDGSRDRSLAMLREMHAQDPRIKVIHLSRNFGPPARGHRGDSSRDRRLRDPDRRRSSGSA